MAGEIAKALCLNVRRRWFAGLVPDLLTAHQERRIVRWRQRLVRFPLWYFHRCS
jgi:predicted site-specific integrase-resolvase